MSRRFQTGELVDTYRIEGFLGAGGMGEVYLGMHTGLKRYAAIKVLNLSSMNSSLSIRFQNEARLQSNLHHPNIATLYDYKEIGNRLLIFMEFVDGEALEDLVERRFFSVDESLLIFHSIIEAVSFVHSNGVIHRDIKSQNIKLTAEGIPKLLDFGIAKDSQSSKLTKTGGVIGTPNYIAPEQLMGADASIGTDIWASGVLLYELLTGKMPFEADNLGELCEQIKIGQFYPIEITNPAVPHSVIQLVEKCLETEPTKRFQTASDIAKETARVLKSQYGIAVHSTEAINRLFYSVEDNYSAERKRKANQKVARKRKFWVFGFASLFIGLFFFGLIGIWSFSGSNKPTPKPIPKGKIVEKINTLKPTPSKAVLPGFEPTASPTLLIEKKPDIQTASSNNAEQKITIDVIQSSANVIQNGEVVGKTPYELSANVGETITLKLQREGFEEREIQVEVSSRKRVYTYSLKSK